MNDTHETSKENEELLDDTVDQSDATNQATEEDIREAIDN